MKQDIIIAGVGGQGILTIAAVIGAAAIRKGLHVKQSEVHGMAQRGGSVVTHLRLSAAPIPSDLIPRGGASLVLAMEPMEGLRYLPLAQPDAMFIANRNPVRNIPDYPAIEALLARIAAWPRRLAVDADQLAKEAGTARAANSVMLGAASAYLALPQAELRAGVAQFFAAKGPEVVEKNLKAFDLGRAAAEQGW